MEKKPGYEIFRAASLPLKPFTASLASFLHKRGTRLQMMLKGYVPAFAGMTVKDRKVRSPGQNLDPHFERFHHGGDGFETGFGTGGKSFVEAFTAKA
jgi:hypothetical protein